MGEWWAVWRRFVLMKKQNQMNIADLNPGDVTIKKWKNQDKSTQNQPKNPDLAPKMAKNGTFRPKNKAKC